MMQQYILPLALAFYAGVGINGFNSIATPSMRWVVLIIVTAIVVAGRFDRWIEGGAHKSISLICATYILLSVLWSEAPSLTLVKGVAYITTAAAFCALGATWGAARYKHNPYGYLWIMLMAGLVCYVFGATSDNAWLQMNDERAIYQGLALNPNFLGLICLCALPPAIWGCITSSHSRRYRILCASAILLVLAMIVASGSRSALLGAAITLLIVAIMSRFIRITTVLLLLVPMIVAAWAMPSGVLEDFELKVIRKGDPSAQLTASRELIWAESADAAKAGGVFGVGFGLTHGFESGDYSMGNLGYLREKGNSTLALVEEIGVIGACLFGALLIVFFGGMRRIISYGDEYRRATSMTSIAATAGLLVTTQFEAWLLAPGAAPTPVLWAVIGTGMSLLGPRVAHNSDETD